MSGLVQRARSGLTTSVLATWSHTAWRNGRVKIGTDAFDFQEGHAGRYERARYGELRLAPSGVSVLVGLRDADRKPMGQDP